MVDLSVKIGAVTLPNPVMPASGTFSARTSVCVSITREQARNFYYGIRLLPGRIRRPCAIRIELGRGPAAGGHHGGGDGRMPRRQPGRLAAPSGWDLEQSTASKGHATPIGAGRTSRRDAGNRGNPVMDLILWRHAEAEPDEPDADRRLTSKGLKQAARIGDWLDSRLPETCRIIASPTRRTKQTAQALKRKFKTRDEVAPDVAPESVLAAAHWPDSPEAVLVVGHQPTLGRVAALRAGGRDRLRLTQAEREPCGDEAGDDDNGADAYEHADNDASEQPGGVATWARHQRGSNPKVSMRSARAITAFVGDQRIDVEGGRRRQLPRGARRLPRRGQRLHRHRRRGALPSSDAGAAAAPPALITGVERHLRPARAP